MAYLSLYRKYRPQTFAEVIGQEHIVRTITNALNSGRVAHAYLFAGPRGTGKTTFARLLAKGLNCAQGPTGSPCGSCYQCERIANGYSVDVIEIDGASNRGIDEIRELRERVRFAPVEARTKVYIIDEVHMLTNEAFNALLKVLEEPPAHVIFIFATTEAHKIPPTILSRCQKFDFRRFNLTQTLLLLDKVVTAENVNAEHQALVLVARQAEGGMRDALAILDQCLSMDSQKLTVQTVVEVMGIVRRDALAQLTAHLLQADLAKTLQLVNELLSEGVDVRQLARDLALYARDLLLLKVAPQVPDLIAAEDDEMTHMAQQVKSCETSQLLRLLGSLEGLEAELRWASNPGLSLELALVRAVQPEREAEGAGNQVAALAHKVAALEKTLASVQQMVTSISATSATPATQVTAAPAATTVAAMQTASTTLTRPAAVSVRTPITPEPLSESVAPVSAPPTVDVTALSTNEMQILMQLQQGWTNVLSMLKEERLLQTEAFLCEGTPGAVHGRNIVIYFDPKHKFHQASMEQPRCKNAAEKVISRFLGKDVSITTQLGTPPEITAPAPESDQMIESASAHKSAQMPESIPAPESAQMPQKESIIPADEQANWAEQAATKEETTDIEDIVRQNPAVRKALQHLGGRIVGIQREGEELI